MKISSAELIIYSDNEDYIYLNLSVTQLIGIIKLLGLKFNPENGDMTMFSDDSLQKFMDKTINNWEMKL